MFKKKKKMLEEMKLLAQKACELEEQKKLQNNNMIELENQKKFLEEKLYDLENLKKFEEQMKVECSNNKYSPISKIGYIQQWRNMGSTIAIYIKRKGTEEWEEIYNYENYFDDELAVEGDYIDNIYYHYDRLNVYKKLTEEEIKCILGFIVHDGTKLVFEKYLNSNSTIPYDNSYKEYIKDSQVVETRKM